MLFNDLLNTFVLTVIACNSSSMITAFGARLSSMVDRPLIVHWVVGSIPHGEPTAISRSSKCSSVWNGACNRSTAATRKEDLMK